MALNGHGSRTHEDAGVLPGIASHPHARAILLPALPPGRASHAYLFHGPAGTGKRDVARAFAAALLADGVADPGAAAGRVQRGTHPDLTWVRPSGAAEMLVGDIDGPVVGAASRTPFEARRRVFVIEGADRMSEQTANRMLKTLEEPPPHAHLILLAEEPHAILPTVASRCQPVRFEPLAERELASMLREGGADEPTALACARLATGDGRLARWLAGEDGRALRAAAEELVLACAAARLAERPWVALLEAARQEGSRAAEKVRAAFAEQAELLPEKERRAHLRDSGDVERRAERRARAERLELALRLVQHWLRDAWCVAEGAAEALYAADRRPELERLACSLPDGSGDRLRRGVELVVDCRLRLPLNVSEELAAEALCYRLCALLAP